MAIYLPTERFDPWGGLRQGLSNVLQGWQIRQQRGREQQDMTLIGRVLQQAEIDPTKATQLFSEALPRMQTEKGQSSLSAVMSRYMQPEKFMTAPAGAAVVSEKTGQPVAQIPAKPGTEVETWGRPRKAIDNDPYGFRSGTVYQISSRGDTKVIQKPIEGGVSGEVGKELKNYTTAINQTLKKYSIDSGITITPDGKFDIQAFLKGKQAVYEKLQERARKGDRQATTDLSKLDFWYKRIDQLTGIGTPEYQKSRQQTEKSFITHDYIPGKGLVPVGGK